MPEPLRAIALAVPLPSLPTLAIEERPDAGVAVLLAARSAEAPLRDVILRTYGVALPEGAKVATGAHATFIGAGPGVWLAVSESGFRWASALRPVVEGLASVVDQSSGQVLLRLTGLRAGDLLQKNVFIDLCDVAFPPGSAASTHIDHVPVTLWREADGYSLCLPRSYAQSVAYQLSRQSKRM